MHPASCQPCLSRMPCTTARHASASLPMGSFWAPPASPAPCAHGSKQHSCKSRMQRIRCQRHPSPLLLRGLRHRRRCSIGPRYREMQQIPAIPASPASKLLPSAGPGPAQPGAPVMADKTAAHCQLIMCDNTGSGLALHGLAALQPGHAE